MLPVTFSSSCWKLCAFATSSRWCIGEAPGVGGTEANRTQLEGPVCVWGGGRKQVLLAHKGLKEFGLQGRVALEVHLVMPHNAHHGVSIEITLLVLQKLQQGRVKHNKPTGADHLPPCHPGPGRRMLVT
jgi:hypothetical protein